MLEGFCFVLWWGLYLVAGTLFGTRLLYAGVLFVGVFFYLCCDAMWMSRYWRRCEVRFARSGYGVHRSARYSFLLQSLGLSFCVVFF